MRPQAYLQPLFRAGFAGGLELYGWELLCRPRPPADPALEDALRLEALTAAAGFAGLDGLILLNLRPGEAAWPGTADRLLRLCDRAGLDPARLGLELPETDGVPSPRAAAALRVLRREGVRLFYDDVASLPAPFRVLAAGRLPPDGLKLEAAFVRTAPNRLLRALAAFGRVLGAVPVAEGVEAGRDLARLARLGFRHFQGYYLGRPLPLPLLRELAVGGRRWS